MIVLPSYHNAKPMKSIKVTYFGLHRFGKLSLKMFLSGYRYIQYIACSKAIFAELLITSKKDTFCYRITRFSRILYFLKFDFCLPFFFVLPMKRGKFQTIDN